ncbi:MAG: response regulator [Thermoanaerobacteraceae bacterium]|nr:response regulator [Thermoanaerobacteraceae bacterium]
MARILVIDDEKGMCWALRKALTDEGYEVITAGNGPEGLTVLAGGGVDLVLLDIMMPGMSGLEVLENIRQNNKSLPVLVMTALTSMSTALEAMQRGASGYVTKPFQMNNLKETVKKALSAGL